MINQNQLYDLVQDDKSVRQLLLKTKGELSSLFGPAFARMKNYNQDNPHHHLDLLAHTVEVVTNIETPDLIELRIAALFHDIGKPFVARFKGDRHVYYGHPEKSWEISKPILTDIGLAPDTILQIGFYIAYHDAFISFKLKDELPSNPNPSIKEINKENVLEKVSSIIQKQDETNQFVPALDDFSKLMLLCVADANGQAFQSFSHGKMIDSRQNKVNRALRIKEIIDDEIQRDQSQRHSETGSYP